MITTCSRLVLCFLAFVSSLFAEPLDVADLRWAWMDSQIEEEFAPFNSGGITLNMIDATMRKVPEISFGSDLVRLQIINGTVYGPEGNAKELLRRIAEIYPVPDVDVIIHEQDIIWNHWVLPGPVLATCKIAGTTEKMIHFPVQLWALWEGEFIPEIERACAASPWESKEEKIFWRGINNDSDNYNNPSDWTKLRRGKLCHLSKQYPQQIDAAFSGTQSWLVREDLQNAFFQFFPKKSASWEEYVHHKYLIDLDGYVASTPGCAWKLLSNSVVFKHDSRFTLWFYKILIPGIHYIPIKEDLSDLFQKLQWVQEHDDYARQVAENSRQLAHDNLMPEHLYLYCYKVLLKYASLQRFAPKAKT